MDDMDAAAVAAELDRISGESGDQAGVELCQRAKSLIEKQAKRIRLLEAMNSASESAIKSLATKLENTTVNEDKGWCLAAYLRLTDAEREAVEAGVALLVREAANETRAACFSADHKARYTAEADRMEAFAATLRGFLERHAKGGEK